MATSSTLPLPETRSRARPTEGFAIWVTIRTSGRISRMRSAVSRACISFTSAQMTAAGMRQARIDERVAEIRTALQMGNAPILENARKSDIGFRVDDDDRRATQVELLDNAESDALKAAHDDVIADFVFHMRSQFSSSPGCL